MRLAGYNLEDTCRTAVTPNERPKLERVMAGRDDMYCPEADSGMGQKQTSGEHDRMSAYAPKADISIPHRHVRFGPLIDIVWDHAPTSVRRFGTEHVVCCQRTSNPFERKLTHRLDCDRIFDRRENTRTDQDLTGPGFVAKPRGYVGYSADCGIVEAPLEPDGAERGKSVFDTDAEADIVA